MPASPQLGKKLLLRRRRVAQGGSFWDGKELKLLFSVDFTEEAGAHHMKFTAASNRTSLPLRTLRQPQPPPHRTAHIGAV
ncbi:MAG: hypothetical protein P8Y36_10855 [Alphaproteobacteria bacterium]